MAREITSNTGYYFMDVWVLANILQQATRDYCRRFDCYREDPKGRQIDQMTQAARSGVANIAEGLSRQTSDETKIKQLDVARGSLAELQGDYFADILDAGQAPWSEKDEMAIHVAKFTLDSIDYTDDLGYNSGLHILNQISRLEGWIKTDDRLVFANTMYILTKRVILMLQKLMQHAMEDFEKNGGFAENMTAKRLESKAAKAAEDNNPPCPVCGKPMLKKAAKRGRNAGSYFWSCQDYPSCKGSADCT